MPHAIVVSASCAPKPRSQLTAAELNDTALLGLLSQLGGQPAELLARPDWLAMILPILRDDLLVCSNYTFPRGVPLACPIHVLGAADDGRVKISDLQTWSALGSPSFPPRIFSGGHFYFRDAPQEVLEHVRAVLENWCDFSRPLTARVASPREGAGWVGNFGGSAHE